jgi:hypothetical protein
VYTKTNVSLVPDQAFREQLFTFFLDSESRQDLSGWLEDIGQDSKGTTDEKVNRLKEHSGYTRTPTEQFPIETISHLDSLPANELADLCESLRLDSNGPKTTLVRRLYREVGYREGWLLPKQQEAQTITKETVLPFVQWYPLVKTGQYEKDYYRDFYDEMSEVFGPLNVHEQFAIAYGNILKIDFHIGHPQQGGVGIEFKMPTSNGEIQRALGQLDQYVSRYGKELIIVLLPDFINNAQLQLFLDELKRKDIAAVVKTMIF